MILFLVDFAATYFRLVGGREYIGLCISSFYRYTESARLIRTTSCGLTVFFIYRFCCNKNADKSCQFFTITRAGIQKATNLMLYVYMYATKCTIHSTSYITYTGPTRRNALLYRSTAPPMYCSSQSTCKLPGVYLS